MIELKSKADELKRLQKEYLWAKAEHLATVEIEEKAKKKVLQYHGFFAEESGKRIFDYKEDFLMPDEQFETYLKLVHKERLKMGLDIPNWELSADYKTCPALRKVEDELLDFTISIMPGEHKEDFTRVKTHWKIRPTMIDLALRLVL